MLDDRDHRPPVPPAGRYNWKSASAEPPSRCRLLLVLLAFGLVALGYAFAAFLDRVLIPMFAAVLS